MDCTNVGLIPLQGEDSNSESASIAEIESKGIEIIHFLFIVCLVVFQCALGKVLTLCYIIQPLSILQISIFKTWKLRFAVVL